MNSEEFQKVANLFEEARRKKPAERSAFLDQACANAPRIRGEVESLLDHHDRDSELLDGSAARDLLGHVVDRALVTDSRSGASPEDSVPNIPEASPIPSKLGPYTVLERIGEGGMGTVYRARQENPRRIVALKVIRVGVLSPGVLRRFQLEANVLGQLRHIGIAQIYEAGTAPPDRLGSPGHPFLAMEFVDGLPLTDYAESNALDTNGRLELFARVCDAVHHAHEKGVIHRDIKPANVLVDRTGQPKILDFGVARATDSDIQVTTLHTNVGQLIGTIPFMSPEQVCGDSSKLDARSDVYSLGVLLYKLLTNRFPYELQNRSIPDAIRVIQTVEPEKMSSIRTVFRGDVETIVAKALEKDPARRYNSAAALALDLRRYLSHKPIGARPPSTLYQFRKFATRNKALVGGIAVVFLVLVAGTVVSSSQAARATRAEHLARTRLQEALAAQSQAEEKQAEAERQTKIAQAVNEFLNEDLLAGVDPENTSNREITVREVLERASDQIKDKFKDEPVVEASIRETLGKTYRNLGLFDLSAPHLQRALEIRRAALGDRDPDTLNTANELALTYMYLDDFDQAEPLLVQTLEAQRAVLGDEHPDTLTIMNNLAMLYYRQHRFGDAEKLYVKTLETQERLLGEEDASTLDTMNNLGMLYYDQHRYDKAEPLYTRALELKRRTLGDDHPRTLDTMNNLAQLYRAQSRFDLAEPLYRQTLTAARRVLGDRHPRTLTTWDNLARMYTDAHRYQEAEAVLVELLNVIRDAPGEDDPQAMVVMNSLADVFRAQGKLEKARDLYVQTLELRKRVLGPEHPKTLASMNNLASLYRKMKLLDLAEPLYVEAAALHKRVLGEENPGTRFVLNGLGLVFYDQGRFKEAESVHRRVLEARLQALGETNRRTALSMSNLARDLAAQDRLTDAAALFERALRASPKGPTPGDALWGTIRAYYGDCLGKLGRFADAEGQLLEGHQMLLDAVGPDHERTKRSVSFLIRFYELNGNTTEAAKWRDLQAANPVSDSSQGQGEPDQ